MAARGSVARLGPGFVFNDASGQTVLTLMHLPAGQPALVAWPHPDRPPPDPVPTELSGRPAIRWGSDQSQASLLVRTSAGDAWLVGGSLPLTQLLKIASSLAAE